MATLATPDPVAPALPAAAALLRLARALEVIGAHCAAIGVRILRSQRLEPRT